MKAVLAVDVGTQSLRVCVINHHLETFEKKQVSYPFKVRGKNQVEIDAEVLWNAFKKTCSQLRRPKSIGAISFSTLCPSLLAMNSKGDPLTPMILHLDRRSYTQALWALERVGEEKFLRISGNLPIPGGISLTSLLWIKEHQPAIYQRSDVVFGHGVTFFMKRLAGRFCIDPSNASFTGFYDTVGYGDWDDGLLADLQIAREKLPEVVMSATVAGKLSDNVAATLKLPRGIPVVIGANDTTCAAVGAGVTEPGKLMNSSGTVENMVLCLDRPITGKNHLLRTHACRNRWLAMRTVGAGGASLEWFRKTFCPEMARSHFYDNYLAKVLSTPSSPEARFHPFLSGDRHRVKQKTGAFTRLSLHTTREDLLLALAYAIVSFLGKGLQEWQKVTPLERTIYHVGGGAGEAYTQYKQTILKSFKFLRLGETTLKGAAKLAFEALEQEDIR
jgi:xylulokinase